MSKRSKKKHAPPTQLSTQLPKLSSSVRLTVDQDRLEVVYANIRWVNGIVLLTFSSFWVRELCWFIASLFRQDWGTGEMGILVILSCVALVLFCAILYCFFHRERLRIDANGLDWRLSVILPVRHRKIDWGQLVAFCPGYCNPARSLIRGQGCEVETVTKTFFIFLDMDGTEDGAKLRKFMQHFVTVYRNTHGIATPVSKRPPKKEQASQIPLRKPLVTNRWKFHDGGFGSEVTMKRRGWVSLISLIKILLICLFWSGGVSVFVGLCISLWIKGMNLAFQWFLTIFLIPFELIALMILATVLATILQYFCRYKITIDDTTVHYRRSWFGIGWTRHWDFEGFANITILCNRTNLKWRNTVRNPETLDSGGSASHRYPYAVYFSDGTDVKKTSRMIRDLLEGEARFIAAQIRKKKLE